MITPGLRRSFALVALATASLLLSGCVSSILANLAVKAPNLQHKPRDVRDWFDEHLAAK